MPYVESIDRFTRLTKHKLQSNISRINCKLTGQPEASESIMTTGFFLAKI
jgi:hypothetical protein